LDANQNLRDLYPRLIEGDASVIGVFTSKATVDAPLTGKQLPPEFIAETRAWLDYHAARVTQVADVLTPGRAAHEFVLTLDIDGEQRELPIMLVAELDGERIRDLRVYHSTWPVTGRHELRRPLMDYHLSEPLPDSILAGRPMSAVVGTITDDGDTAVYEYMAEAWDGAAMQPQGGAAACAHGTCDGSSTRIYDDIEAPIVVAEVR
jgi:hypothetical protein